MERWNIENVNGIQQCEVKRSQDGNNFTVEGGVVAANNVQQQYVWLDQLPFAGNNYYRGRSIFKDGQT